MRQPTLLEMLKAGIHFGHIPSKRHPKMKPYIFGVRAGVHIIDLEKTQHYLDKTRTYAKDVAAKGGIILFVATKKQAQEHTKIAAEKCGMPYIHEHWIGGLLTNFVEIKKVIKRYNVLKKQYEDNEFGEISKKDKVLLDKEYEKLSHKVSGISALTKMPDVIFMIDIKKEKTALAEATKVGIPVIGVCDSNTNPETVTYPIPGNDDATRSIILMLDLMSEAVAEGRVEYEKSEDIAAKKREEDMEKKKIALKEAKNAELKKKEVKKNDAEQKDIKKSQIKEVKIKKADDASSKGEEKTDK